MKGCNDEDEDDDAKPASAPPNLLKRKLLLARLALTLADADPPLTKTDTTALLLLASPFAGAEEDGARMSSMDTVCAAEAKRVEAEKGQKDRDDTARPAPPCSEPDHVGFVGSCRLRTLMHPLASATATAWLAVSRAEAEAARGSTALLWRAKATGATAEAPESTRMTDNDELTPDRQTTSRWTPSMTPPQREVRGPLPLPLPPPPLEAPSAAGDTSTGPPAPCITRNTLKSPLL
jgi:hypothetical protein